MTAARAWDRIGALLRLSRGAMNRPSLFYEQF